MSPTLQEKIAWKLAGATVGRESDLVGDLVWRNLELHPSLRPLVDDYLDAEALTHFGEEELLPSEHHRRITRYFYAWRVERLRERIGERLQAADVLDVGDSNGLFLRALGKHGVAVNVSSAAIENVRAHGIEAHLGDALSLPFPDDSFDYVLCFQTFEHVENPVALLDELARVCRPEGRVFVSIPSVTKTTIFPRDPTKPRGMNHVFELSRKDFAAVVSHSRLRIVWEDVCSVIGPPKTLRQRFLLLRKGRRDVLGWSFRRFAFFELGIDPTPAG